MVFLMACCTSWGETVRSKTASIVETVTTGRTMVNVFMDVVGGRMDCMPNMLWLKEQRLRVRIEIPFAGVKVQCLQLRMRAGERGW
jgi:hypothetical protein